MILYYTMMIEILQYFWSRVEDWKKIWDFDHHGNNIPYFFSILHFLVTFLKTTLDVGTRKYHNNLYFQ